MYLHSVAMICPCLLVVSCPMLIPREGHATIPGNTESPEAVKEVLSGKRTVANAAWWGFDEFDATEALQSAINSGAKRVIVPNMTRDWIVRPINLAGDQELVFEDGVVVTAKRGEFKGKGECLLRGVNIRNLTIRVSSSMGGGIRVAGVREEGAQGLIEFRDCTIENVEKFGLEINRESSDGVHLRFDNCIWRNVARGCATEIPLQIILRPHIRRNGGVEFVKCMVEDSKSRPFIIACEEGKTTGLHDITGEVTVCNPWFRARRDSQSANNAVTALGDKTHNVNLRVMEKW
jgi:hypothetical protein